MVAVEDNTYHCRTIKRRADEICYDRRFFDGIAVRFEDFILKGAKTVVHVNVPKAGGGDRQSEIPTKSAEIIPRRLYVKPADFVRHGFTQGCPGCVCARTGIGPKRNHSEICRQRLEAEIVKDLSDTRTVKAQERMDHYLAKKVAESKRDEDPRQDLVEEPVEMED